MVKRPMPPPGSGLFGDAQPERKPQVAAFRANIDGGSRGNPGPASYGVVIRDDSGAIVARLKKYIGRSTNNVAEYFGLIAALDYAQTHDLHSLHVESDSELLVKQMRGQYRVKSPELQPLFERAKKMSQSLASFRINHVYREQNLEADALANEALDETAGAKPSSQERKEKPAAKEPQIRTTATYRDGILQPDEPLNLPEGAEVEIVLRLRR
jgi:ribonuclease HI